MLFRGIVYYKPDQNVLASPTLKVSNFFLSGNKEGERFEYTYDDDVFVPEYPPYKETLLFNEPGKQSYIDVEKNITTVELKTFHLKLVLEK